MNLEERKQSFIELCQSYEVSEGFIDYWTEHSINGKKMRFEKEKVFDIKRRWGTWERNNQKWNTSKPSQMLNAYDQARHNLGI